MKAFPNTNHFDDGYGMDLRDYFAARAMQGLLDSKIIMEICQMTGDKELPELVATMSYNMADAMIKERDRVDDSHEIMAAAIMKKKAQE
jgi:hypothetical protein